MRSSLYPLARSAGCALILAMVCLAQTVTAAPYSELGGERVLLLNNYQSPASTIVKQSFADLTALDDTPIESAYCLKDGTEFKLVVDDARAWHLTDVRVGNVFDRSGDAQGTIHNYLPWDHEHSYSFDDASMPAVRQRDAGQIALRQSRSARIVSPKYEDGIGRIYFDAVNFSIGSLCNLGLFVCTDTDEALADPDNWETNTVNWTQAEVTVYAITNGIVAEVETGSTITLNMTQGGSVSNFYRVVLADSRFVNLREPAYFKIARTDSPDPDDPDGEGLILVDNIVCSYPVPEARIEPAGTYESWRSGERVVGWAGAVYDAATAADSPVLPYFGAAGLKPRARLAVKGDRTGITVADAKFHYRWRYLDQLLLGNFNVCTNDAMQTTGKNATLSGARLRLPPVDETFTNLAARVTAIVLGNDSYQTAADVQYLGIVVNGTMLVSGRLNGDGNYNTYGRNPDNSWKLRFEFDPAVEVRTGHDYEIYFLDGAKDPIFEAAKMRVVNPDSATDKAYSVLLNEDDGADPNPAGYTALQASVEYEFDGNFRSMAMTADELGNLTGDGVLDDDLTAQPGDIEFYYTATVEVPYYRWLDYSGLSGTWPGGELDCPAATGYRRTDGITLPSRGTDYFVRLRDGRSNLTSFDVEVEMNGATNCCSHSALTADWAWTVLMPTPSNGTARVRFRIVDSNNTTNYLSVGSWTYEEWPASIRVPDESPYVAADNAWSEIGFSDIANYLRFSYNQNTKVLLIARAEYQDFNGWDDASKYHREVFVGTGVNTNNTADTVTGVSSHQHTYANNFAVWNAMSATNAYWRENFDRVDPDEVDEEFTEATTFRNFKSGPGKYVNRTYNNAEYALQMQGRGNGKLQYIDDKNMPRGIDTVNFVARLAQPLWFSSFSTYNGVSVGHYYALTNYAFTTRAVMGYRSAGHDGKASLSLVARHGDQRGCYEFRVTQIAAGNNYECQLYRWNYDSDNDDYECTLLKTLNLGIGVELDATTAKTLRRFPALVLSVEDCTVAGNKPGVKLLAGVQVENSSNQARYNIDQKYKDATYNLMSYIDLDDKRHRAGSFGVATCNCPGRFARPAFHSEPLYIPGWSQSNYTQQQYETLNGSGGKFSGHSGGTILQGEQTWLDQDIKNGDLWKFGDWMAAFFPDDFQDASEGDANWGLTCKTNLAQQIIVSLADGANTNFKPVTTNNITGFALREYKIDVQSRQPCSVQLSTGGKLRGVQTDVVIADVEFTQWCGTGYDGGNYNETQDGHIGDYKKAAPSEFVFTSSWVHDIEDGNGKVVELNPHRAPDTAAAEDNVISIRAPLMDNSAKDGRGVGLGMLAFSYTNCDERVEIEVQFATNSVGGARLTSSEIRDITKLPADDDSVWHTITNFTGAAVAEQGLPLRRSGVASCYIGMHSVTGVVRLVLKPSMVAAAQATDDKTYGRIFIDEVVFRDEPGVDPTCWWGWNMRTGSFRREYGDEGLRYLADGSYVGLEALGMSGALNCSTTDRVLEGDTETSKQHLPFIQTPSWSTSDEAPVVGELSFKARRYDTETNATARVTIYGAANGSADDDAWEYVAHFDIDCNIYTNFVCKRTASTYKAYRLAVAGVPKANPMVDTEDAPEPPDPVVRVALDNIYVMETINPKVIFSQVMAFRGDLDKSGKISWDERKARQPLLLESFGVQAKVDAVQMPEEIDLERGYEVSLSWKVGEGVTKWGYETWRTKPSGGPVVLQRCSDCADNEYVFRSTLDGDSVINIDENDNEVKAKIDNSGYLPVQYMLTVKYYVKNHGNPDEPRELSIPLDQDQWVKPEWYEGVDKNAQYGGVDEKGKYGKFAAYTILEPIAPDWAWINEVNLIDQYVSSSNCDMTNQYIEVAMPYPESGSYVNLKDWKLRLISLDSTTNTVQFGKNNLPIIKPKKTPEDTMVFMTVGSPAMKNGTDFPESWQFDGTWGVWANKDSTFLDDGSIKAWRYPLAIQLVRPSNIIAHEIVCGGTNTWAKNASLGPKYSAERFAATLNEKNPDANLQWLYVGDDYLGGDNSLSVTNAQGMVAEDWTNAAKRTPGAVNEGQVLDGTPPYADGSLFVLQATIEDGSKGYLQHRLADGELTTEPISIAIRKGSPTGTNITYRLLPFHEIKYITTNTAELAEYRYRAGSDFEVVVGQNMSNRLEVVAAAQVMHQLADEYGVTAENLYRNDIIDWLVQGQTKRGPFKHPQPESADQIKLAQYVSYSGKHTSPLKLTEMYWLDMDPTDTEDTWYLRAGFKDCPEPKPVKGFAADRVRMVDEVNWGATNNVVISLFMCISNEDASVVYAPYMLRGLDGADSQNYTGTWRGATLQITSKINNQLAQNQGFKPVDWFVFTGNGATSTSFPGDGDEKFTTIIEVLDPHSLYSPGYQYGFYDFPKITPWFRWKLDSDGFREAKRLNPTNLIDEAVYD